MDKGMVNIPDDSIHSLLQMDMTGTMEGPESGGWRDQVHLMIHIDGKNYPAMPLDRPCQQRIVTGGFRQDDIQNHHLRFFDLFKKGRIVNPPERPRPEFLKGFLVNFDDEDIVRGRMRPT